METKQQYGFESHKNIPENEKQKLGEYRKKVILQKIRYSNYTKLSSFSKPANILKVNDKEEIRAEYQDFF